MKLSQFKFRLPEENIALYPRSYNPETGLYDRDQARMMVVHRKTGEIEHGKLFKDIIDYFDEGDVFIFNDTKVFPARLYGNKEKTGARIEVFLLRELNADLHFWDVLVDPARKIRIGNKLYFGPEDEFVAEVIDNTTSRGRTLRFLTDMPHEEFKEKLYAMGEAPLPNDVHSLRPTEECDNERFQTIYAAHEGAVTAPSTGMHFSRALMKRMEIKGIEQAFITLHAGLGNFRSIDVEDLTKHKPDSEQIIVNKQACDLFNTAKESGHRTCAVGATVLRSLETCVGPGGKIKEYDGWTNKFIFPPYEFDTVNSFVVNLQLPLSQMLMATCAFGGYDLVMKAYNEAVKEGYMFGTFGDTMLIID